MKKSPYILKYVVSDDFSMQENSAEFSAQKM